MIVRRPIEKKLPRASLRHERGQSLVEFSISMMVVLLLLSGVLDIGRAFYSYLALRDAAQEGASYGSIAPSDSGGIRTRVRELSNGPIDLGSFGDDQIDVQVTGSACASGSNALTVAVEFDFLMVSPFLGGKTLPLSATATSTILQPPC